MVGLTNPTKESIESDFAEFLEEESAKYGRTLGKVLFAIYLNRRVSKLLGNSSFDKRVLRRNFWIAFVPALAFLVISVMLLLFVKSDSAFNLFRVMTSIALLSFLASITIWGKVEILTVIGTESDELNTVSQMTD